MIGVGAVAQAETLGVCRTRSGTGWLEKTGQGDLVLHLQGSYYDMGFEHATLLRDQTQAAVRSLKYTIHKKTPLLPSSWVIGAIDKFVFQKEAPYLPREYLEEMQGLADASGVDLKIIHAAQALTYLTSCETAAAWGPATRDGALYFIRSNDDFVSIDPQTKASFNDLKMIVIYQPLNEIPYLIVNLPGLIGASDGINAEGIAIGNMSLPSRYETAAGVPMQFRIKQTLAQAHNLDEAIKWMSVKPFEGGYNFIVADAKIPSAKAIEMDSEKIYVGGWNGPAESYHYVFNGVEFKQQPMNGLIMRANHPLSQELMADFKEDLDYGGKNYTSGPRYLDLRQRLLKEYGALDLVKMFEIMRASYQRMDYGDGPTMGASTHQLAFAPKTGDLLIAFSKGDPMKLGRKKASAFNQPYHRYNFFALLAERP